MKDLATYLTEYQELKKKEGNKDLTRVTVEDAFTFIRNTLESEHIDPDTLPYGSVRILLNALDAGFMMGYHYSRNQIEKASK